VNRFDEAEAAFRKTVDLLPDHADAWAELAQVFVILKREAEAVSNALDKALSLDSEHTSALNQKAYLLSLQGDQDAAIAMLKHAVATAPQKAELHVNLGDMLLMYDTPSAIEAYQAALKINETFPEARAKLARAYERINKIEDARTLIEAELRDCPQSFLARLTQVRCDLRDQKRDAAKATLTSLSREQMGTESFTQVQKTLATVLDREGDFAAAFDAAACANERQLADDPISVPAQEKIYADIDANLKQITKDTVEGWLCPKTSAYKSPIFFVGFPRSGTTLMEQILRVHPRFVSSDENEWVRKTFETVEPDQRNDLSTLGLDRIEALRGDYWRQVELRCGPTPHDQRRIDKMPLNILHLAFIRRIFPDAQVLVAIRDPRDCVLSGFMQAFQRTHLMDQFLTLEAAARFYGGVMDLWAHYETVLGLNAFAYRYEDLVTAPRVMMEEILSFLGEPWDENVLQHNTLMRAEHTVATPSLRDVSEAIYTRSKQRWPQYADQLAPVMDVLAPYIQRFGYAAQ